MKKVKVLFVCLGNICRSPLAEGVFKHKIKQRNLEMHFEVDSCGTSNYQIGDRPDHRTVANATKNGVALEHIARQIKEDDLADFDLILAMDANNYRNILQIDNATNQTHKVKMMRDFDPHGKGDVPDPYHGKEIHFQEVFEILDRTMNNFIDHLEKEHLSLNKNL